MEPWAGSQGRGFRNSLYPIPSLLSSVPTTQSEPLTVRVAFRVEELAFRVEEALPIVTCPSALIATRVAPSAFCTLNIFSD